MNRSHDFVGIVVHLQQVQIPLAPAQYQSGIDQLLHGVYLFIRDPYQLIGQRTDVKLREEEAEDGPGYKLDPAADPRRLVLNGDAEKQCDDLQKRDVVDEKAGETADDEDAY